MLHTLTLLALFINFTTAFSFSETQNHGITCGKPIISSKFSPKLLQIDPKTLKPRVVGGKDYTIENHPWNVLLLLGTETDPYDSICGGSVISNDWIITAGHCTNEATEDYSKAVIGKTQIETDFQKYSQNSYGYPIQKMYTHPDYDNSMTNNDIGLLRLAQTLTFSRQIQPICLPKNIICLQKDTKVTITGWGSTTKDGQSTSPTLQGALLPVKSAEYCTEKYKTSYLQETMTCAANGDGIDACDGDSGSPLVFKDSSGADLETVFKKLLNRLSQLAGENPSKIVNRLDLAGPKMIKFGQKFVNRSRFDRKNGKIMPFIFKKSQIFSRQ